MFTSFQYRFQYRVSPRDVCVLILKVMISECTVHGVESLRMLYRASDWKPVYIKFNEVRSY